MNGALLPEMLHCDLNGGDMTILERQRSRTGVSSVLRQSQQQSYFHGAELGCFQGLLMGSEPVIGEVAAARIGPVKADPGLENGWPELGRFEISGSGFGPAQVGSGLSRTASCPPARDLAAPESQGFNKRKAQNTKVVVAEDDIKDKKLKGWSEDGESKITTEQNSNKNGNRETSADTSKDNSKASEVQNQKTDYIHVRARRGQATDSHSLAERVRREKISERMKYLQDLVPGCNKITGKAGMLDEIINYVQSLQRQVEFLSMKLATVNPRMDFNIDNMFAKEMEMVNQAYMQFSPVISGCGLDMGIGSPEMALRRTISAPVSFPEPFLDSSCFTQIQNSGNWDGDLQNMYNIEYQQGRPTTSFQHHPFTGSMDASDLKMEM